MALSLVTSARLLTPKPLPPSGGFFGVTMKVIYKGPYRAGAVFYKGVTFIEGEPAEVSEEWYALNKAFVVTPKKRVKKVSDDNSN